MQIIFTMEFCPKCKAILVSDDQGILSCSCGFQKNIEKREMIEKVKPEKEIEVIHDEINPLAVYDHKCKKCGFGKAQLISKGIWYGDEDEVVEYVCGRCGRHERAEGLKVT